MDERQRGSILSKNIPVTKDENGYDSTYSARAIRLRNSKRMVEAQELGGTLDNVKGIIQVKHISHKRMKTV